MELDAGERARDTAIARGAMRLWLLRVTLGRVRAAWRLLLVVQVVALLASTTVASVGLLQIATEQGAVHSALAALSSSQTTFDLQMTVTKVPLAKVRASATRAIRTVLGGSASFTQSGTAVTTLDSAPGLGTLPALTYFGEMDAIRSHASLTAGVWAAASTNPSSSGSPVAVTVPAAAATGLGLHLGSTFPVQTYDGNKTARVVGLYRATDPHGAYWRRDALQGEGYHPDFPKPGTDAFIPTNAFGPLIVASGALAAAHIPVQTVDVKYVPQLAATTPGQLPGLIDRLSAAESDVPAEMGDVADQIYFSTDFGSPLSQIVSNLIVTRSTVVVVILLLLVLAVAVLAQTARLFNDARDGERQLMRARGASRRQIFALAALEAGVIGVVTAALSPLLARVAYLALATIPAMRAAGMPGDAGTPLSIWAIAGGVALLFVAVLLIPLLARPGSFVDDEKSRVRQRRSSGLMRSGADVGVVLLAGILYWQLQTYRTPVSGTSSLSVDPVLVTAPAIVLLAGAFVCVRLIPLASRLGERIGLRSRGAIFSLAAWEVSRRSRRVTAAVLLLTLALAVGTFSQSFLSTWRQSQVDQASLAVGPPVRVPADAAAAEQAALLARGARGKPQPVIRQTVSVAGSDASPLDPGSLDGTDAVVLGLSPTARDLIARGRLASEGGARIVSSLAQVSAVAGAKETSIQLPGDVTRLSATVQVGNAGHTLAGVSAGVRAIVQDENGLLSTVDLGEVPVDASPHSLSGSLPPAHGVGPALPLRFVGLQTYVFMSNPATYGVDNDPTLASILVKNLAAQDASGARHRLSAPVPASWFGETGDDDGVEVSTNDLPTGWQLGMHVLIPPEINTQSAAFSLTGWKPVRALPAVLSSGLATSVDAKAGTSLTLVFSGALVKIRMVAAAPLIPGSTDSSLLTAATASGAVSSETGAVVVDQGSLERALAQAGVPGPLVDEWWVDVAPGRAQAYLDQHPTASDAPPDRSAEVLGLQMQQDPSRVATQAALWLAIVAAALLAAVGFAVHATGSLRSRRLEFAELRAIGLSRRALVAVIGAESLLLCVLGSAFSIGIGVLVSWLVGPLVAVSPDGSPPVPSVVIAVPWAGVALSVVEVVAVLACVVLIAAGIQRSTEPSDLLREAGDS